MTTPDEVVVVTRAATGRLVVRTRLRWRARPTAAAVLGELAALALAARRRGLVLRVESAPDWLAELVRLAGLADQLPLSPPAPPAGRTPGRPRCPGSGRCR